LAGREFQRHFGIADKRRAVDFELERQGNLTADQLLAWKWLAKCYRALGADGSALINDVLIDAKTARQITESRGKKGLGWERFYNMRLRECLNTLAGVYGFSSVPEVDRTNEAITRPLRRGLVARQR
jgi:hypothetical protein